MKGRHGVGIEAAHPSAITKRCKRGPVASRSPKKNSRKIGGVAPMKTGNTKETSEKRNPKGRTGKREVEL